MVAGGFETKMKLELNESATFRRIKNQLGAANAFSTILN